MASAHLTIHSEQLPRVATEGRLQLREDVLYTDPRGRENRSVAKRARRTLERLREPLERLMEPDEAILYVARGQVRLSTIHQLTLGWAAYSIARTELVFTSERLLCFRVERNGKWTRSLRAVRWEDVSAVKAKGWVNHMLEFKYNDGSNESYWQLKRADKKKAEVLAAALTQRQGAYAGAAKGAVSLCPECLAALTPHVYNCAACGLIFKDESTLLWRAVLVPGGGYFYARQPGLGLLDGLVETILTVWLIYWGLGFAGVFVVTDELNQPMTAAEAGASFAIILFLLAFEKAITIYHGKYLVRDFLPTKKKLDSANIMAAGAGSIG